MIELYYIEKGNQNNPKLLLLHGLGMAHRMWQPQLAELSKNFHLLIPDIPGLAKSASSGPFSIEGCASALLDFIRGFSDQGYKIYVCGLSLGAMVALKMAILSQGEISSLILSGGQVKPPRIIMLFQKLIFSLTSKKRILAQIPKTIPTDDENIKAAAREDANLTGKAGFINVLKSMGKVDFTNQLSIIRMPTLVLCGEKDTPNLKAANKLAEGIPDAILKIVPGMGHVWNFENPDLFNQIIIEFLSK
jgi:3-oxoadipate enol-lactonase